MHGWIPTKLEWYETDAVGERFIPAAIYFYFSTWKTRLTVSVWFKRETKNKIVKLEKAFWEIDQLYKMDNDDIRTLKNTGMPYKTAQTRFDAAAQMSHE